MTGELKTIKVLGVHGPNAPKVSILCEELGFPYEAVDIPFDDVKKPYYLAININGRLPSLQDPNTDLTLWETGAILEYLTETYDKDHKLSFPAGSAEFYHARQWLYFQTTGQGPYYGQAMWFIVYHHEQLPSARERYVKEVGRITSVLNDHLAMQKPDADGNLWLVGSKLSYADLAFVTWQNTVNQQIKKDEFDPDKYPHTQKWLKTMLARPSAKKILKL